MTDEALNLSNRFVQRCLRAAGDMRCVVDTNSARGPFVAEWSTDAVGFRVRLICGRAAATVRVFSWTLAPHTAHDLAQALIAASDVGAVWEEVDCGGTYAEIAAAHDMTEPLGKRAT